MIELLAWLWLPVMLYTLALGCGLLSEVLAGFRLPNQLVAPVGLAVILLLITPGYELGRGAATAAVVVVLAAIAGLLAARRSIRSRLWPGWMPVAAGVGAYALYLAPVALSGDWSWAGYEFVNDTAANMVFASHVAENGATLPAELDSTTDVIAATPVELDYPLGAHFLLATLQPLSGAPLAAIYQPLIAAVGALAAMGFATVARRAGLPAVAAGVAGLMAVVPNLLYRYVLHGAIKEIVVVALLAAAAAVGGELLARRSGLRPLVLLIVAVVPLLGVFSAVGAIYGLALTGPLLAVALWRARPSPKRVAAAAAAVIVVGAAVAGPTILDTVKFGGLAREAFAEQGGASTAFFGHLVRPLPLEQAAGVWFGRDYRYPQVGGGVLATDILVGIVAVLLIVGVASTIRRRNLPPLALLFATAAPVALLTPLLSPYADAKLLVVLSPAIVLLAGIGAYALGRGGWVRRGVAGLAATAVIVGILGSAAVAYREVRLAPVDRMEAMEDAAAHADGGGLWLVNEWEEFGRYFMRDIRVNMAFEAESPEPAQLRDSRPAGLRVPRPIFGQYYDLDEQQLEYVTQFPGIIMRRSPVASRPPASFERVYENTYYEVWRRRAGKQVTGHLPLQALLDASGIPNCAEVERMAALAGPGERLVAARRPEVSRFDTAAPANRIRGWELNRPPQPRRTVTPTIAGVEGGSVSTASGRFEVWLRGSFGRAISVSVDGRSVGAAGQVNTPGQWLPVGTVDLSAGEHQIEIRRPETSLAPGDGYRGYIGPVALQPVAGGELVSVDPDRARSLCGKRWDWIERMSG